MAVGPADSYERPLRVALEATERDTTGADTLPEREAAVLRLVVLCAAELREELAAELRDVLWEALLRVELAAELRVVL